jgi:hypothetical protein
VSVAERRKNTLQDRNGSYGATEFDPTASCFTLVTTPRRPGLLRPTERRWSRCAGPGGRRIDEKILAISPRRSENINSLGFNDVDIDAELAKLGPNGYRPLRVRDTPF